MESQNSGSFVLIRRNLIVIKIVQFLERKKKPKQPKMNVKNL
jgi:hypothetical protein